MALGKRWRFTLLIPIGLFAFAFVPHWRTVGRGELLLPEGYLAFLSPKGKERLRPTPWNALWWDGIGQFWAWRTETIRQLRQGRIPLWTNRIGCGFPFLANPQTMTLYPPLWFLQGLARWILPEETAAIKGAWCLKLLAFFHTALALFGSFLLWCSFGLTPLASLLGAVAYGLSAFSIAWILLPTLPATSAWLPLTLWFVRKVTTGAEGWRWGVGFALSLAMLLLAGHGQIALYALVALFLFAFIALMGATNKPGAIGTLLIGAVLGFLLAAPQLLPTAELVPLTHRSFRPTWDGYLAFVGRGLTLNDLGTLLIPFLFGDPMDGTYFGKESFADYCTFVGFGVVVLALFSLAMSARRLFTAMKAPLTKPSILLSAVHPAAFPCLFSLFLPGLLFASGSIFNLPFYFLVPGFAQFGTPTRAVFLCHLGLSGLAAIGWDELWSEGLSGRKRLLGWVVLIFVLSFALWGTVQVGKWVMERERELTWGVWGAFLFSQNNGVLGGLFALLLTLSMPRSSLRPFFALLLCGELLWFATRQVPTARLEAVRNTLRSATDFLQGLEAPPFSLTRLLPLGLDWHLDRHPKTLLPPNSLLLLDVPFTDARNYDSLLLRHHKAVMAVFSGGNPCPLANGNMILMPANAVTEPEKLAFLLGAEAFLVPSRDGFRARRTKGRRCFVPRRVHFVVSPEEAIGQLARLSFGDTFLVGAFGDRIQPEVRVRLVEDSDSFLRVALKPTEKHQSFWVILCDVAYPGWKAWGRREGRWQRLAASVANGAFRACFVPDGTVTEICWVHFPSSLVIGMFLGLIGWTLSIIWVSTSFLVGAKGGREDGRGVPNF